MWQGLGRTVQIVVLIQVVFLSSIVVMAQNAPASQLQTDLSAQYKSDKVLVIQKDGLVGVSPSTLVTCGSKYQDGNLHSPNGLCVMAVKNNSKTLVNGEKVHPTKVEVIVKSEQVKVSFVECDSCNGVTEASAYKGQIIFQYPKAYLESADAGQVMEIINQVLAPQTNEAPAQQPATADAQPAQQEAASPPPPASIQVGQTVAEVVAAFGQPEKIVTLPNKLIYVYKDLKVTFINGKVADVQ